jgi:hypothetical protein
VKTTAAIILVLLISGCAIVEDPEAVGQAGKHAPFEPISSSSQYRRVEHGVITAREVQERSDIVVIPPSVQHVVWQRDGLAIANVAQPRPTEPRSELQTEPLAERPIDDWPLLAEDMNFESEIGRVPMCRPTKACVPGEDCPELIPCERADELSCYRVKQGDYCLENIQ